MSVSVINPISSKDLYKLKSTISFKPQRSTVTVTKIKRNLFGSIDRESHEKFVAEKLAKQCKEASEKWGFNFETGRPIENQTKLSWQSTVMQPAVYTLTHAAHVIENRFSLCSETESSSDEYLLDESIGRSDSNCSLIVCDKTSPKVDVPCSEIQIRTIKSLYNLRRPENNSITSNKNNGKLICTKHKAEPAKRQPKITDFLKEKKKSITASPAATKLSMNNNTDTKKTTTLTAMMSTSSSTSVIKHSRKSLSQ